MGQSRLSRLLDAAEHLARGTTGGEFSQQSWRIHPSSGALGNRRRAPFFPYSSYATVHNDDAHYMGVPEGARIWEGIEARWEDLLRPGAQERLIAHLAKQFG